MQAAAMLRAEHTGETAGSLRCDLHLFSQPQPVTRKHQRRCSLLALLLVMSWEVCLRRPAGRVPGNTAVLPSWGRLWLGPHGKHFLFSPVLQPDTSECDLSGYLPSLLGETLVLQSQICSCLEDCGHVVMGTTVSTQNTPPRGDSTAHDRTLEWAARQPEDSTLPKILRTEPSPVISLCGRLSRDGDGCDEIWHPVLPWEPVLSAEWVPEKLHSAHVRRIFQKSHSFNSAHRHPSPTLPSRTAGLGCRKAHLRPCRCWEVSWGRGP